MNPDITFDNYSDTFENDDFIEHGILMDDVDDSEIMSISLKWILDGATSMAEMIELARGFVGYLEDLERNGYDLVDVVDRGHISLAIQPKSELSDSIF